MANGDSSKWILWMAGIIMVGITTGLGTLTTNVVANDKLSRTRDTVNDKASIKRDYMLEQRVDTTEQHIGIMKNDIGYIKQAQTTGRQEQKQWNDKSEKRDDKMLELLQEIHRKAV